MQIYYFKHYFTVNYISFDEIKQGVFNLNKNVSREANIPVSILKDATDTYLPILTKIINTSTKQNGFPNNLKLSFHLQEKQPS